MALFSQLRWMMDGWVVMIQTQRLWLFSQCLTHFLTRWGFFGLLFLSFFFSCMLLHISLG